jgi:predicted DCC family thiol-disulfide oxidoreductase YuxK
MAYSLSAETPSQESILLLDADRVVYEQADAILRIASSLRGPFRLLVVFWLVPRSLRNVGYRMVARWRYAVFGKRTTCRVPTPEERGLFL